jgi:hypothetical protein
MATQTTTTFPVLPEYAKQPTADMAATLGELLKQQVNVPQQQVAGFSPTQQAAMQSSLSRYWCVSTVLRCGATNTSRGSWNNRCWCTSTRTNEF